MLRRSVEPAEESRIVDLWVRIVESGRLFLRHFRASKLKIDLWYRAIDVVA